MRCLFVDGPRRGTVREVTAQVLVCASSVTVGVDAHDAGISADGVELFACERCCDECGEAS